MSKSSPSLQFGPDLQEYAVPDQEFLRQHPEYDILCTGVAVFNEEGKLLLVRRAKDELAFPNAWEVPGGKVDDTDDTILHAAARELKEEAGLTATRVVRKVTQFTFDDGRPGRPNKTWLKLIFEMEVEDLSSITLDPIEHQDFLFATEEEVAAERVGGMKLAYVSEANKAVKLEAFRLHGEAATT
ncbi:hypothetical protein T440DRAFT_468444 [Plenodomus tracheiphilus IPT5]|uniref:Nudix hydrolase domain-containing protein n=1 Tax=Plenodomus tracheiphilus IPT5 TaxID=1408161 RepID=A0A6A7B7V8_9PLEO|nr:hypothetical protein T440DRAFT_468444 [Plenodomus tracheiphilus IPT5]